MPDSPRASRYDAVVAGGGHNGLVAAAYLARAGASVLVLERAPTVGGAAVSTPLFDGVDARVSVYAYLLGMMPPKIISDLGLEIVALPRDPGVHVPFFHQGAAHSLLFSERELATLRSFDQLPDGRRAYAGLARFRSLQAHLARHLWPGLTEPLVTRAEMRARFASPDEQLAWRLFVEQPLGVAIEEFLDDDLLRGLVCTDGVIGTFAHAHDPSLRQNQTFLYHVIAGGAGDWQVPVGGMGRVATRLLERCRAFGAEVVTNAEVTAIEPRMTEARVAFSLAGREREVVGTRVLSNLAPDTLHGVLPGYQDVRSPDDEGCFVKINMVLARLPRLRSGLDPRTAFTGTFHIDEGYANLEASYRAAAAGQIPERPPGELYCHSLTDPSILSEDLCARGWQTLTLFGLAMPYRLFAADNEGTKREVLARYLRGINRYLAEPLEDCLARDAHGAPCVQIDSPVDIERKLFVPSGHVFHRALAWPWVESADEAGTWGVETAFPSVLLCGSGARRGGCISGIPGHNAAMKGLADLGRR